MSKAQRGNKEHKKPKKDAPAIPLPVTGPAAAVMPESKATTAPRRPGKR